MSKTILICGHGPGISHAMAERFGKAGFAVALVARNGERLQRAVATLQAAKVQAKAFPTDMGDPAAVTAMVAAVRAALPPLAVLHWNGYASAAGDLTTATPAELRQVFDVGVVGLVAAVQAALPDLRKQADAAVLVTGGGLAIYDAKVDALGVQWNAMGLALAKAAQHKLVGLLAEKLRQDRIYVGEVIVAGLVKGTAFDSGNAKLEPAAIAQRFFELYSARTPTHVTFA